MLPKFLIADNSQESTDLVYVIHTQYPRCILETDLDGFFSHLEIHWIDEPPGLQAAIDTLTEEAEEFFEKELDNQEEVYDEPD